MREAWRASEGARGKAAMHHAGLILNHGARLHICSFMSMTSSGDRSIVTVGTRAVRDRDERVDFFRGVALIFIFIDHIPGNTFAKFPLSNFGFADAAEIFVLLAGYAAFLAYA